MNSVKNAIVTMTLLAVGYGAYVVLSNPVPEDVGELADDTAWQSPEVTTSPAADAQPPGDAQSTDSELAVALPPAEVTLPDTPAETLPPADLAASFPPPSTGPAAGPAGTEGSNPPSATPPAGAASTSTGAPTDPGTNYYVSQASVPAADHPSAGGATAVSTSPPPPTGSASSSPGTAGGNPDFETAWQAVQSDLGSGQLGTALGTLSGWYGDSTLSPEQNERLIPLLDQLAGTVIYSRDSFLEPAHVVQQGETLAALAQQYQVPVEFLARINGIEPPHQLHPGETIKVVQGPFRAEVNCRQRQITLYLGRYYAGRFRARIGPELPASDNSYQVASIEPGLEYFDTRTGQRITRDDPENPYGTLWISLRGNQITAAHRVGIHVDNGDPQRGCIGVSETDANDLAAILGPGSEVEVSQQ